MSSTIMKGMSSSTTSSSSTSMISISVSSSISMSSISSSSISSSSSTISITVFCWGRRGRRRDDVHGDDLILEESTEIKGANDVHVVAVQAGAARRRAKRSESDGPPGSPLVLEVGRVSCVTAWVACCWAVPMGGQINLKGALAHSHPNTMPEMRIPAIRPKTSAIPSPHPAPGREQRRCAHSSPRRAHPHHRMTTSRRPFPPDFLRAMSPSRPVPKRKRQQNPASIPSTSPGRQFSRARRATPRERGHGRPGQTRRKRGGGCQPASAA